MPQSIAALAASSSRSSRRFAPALTAAVGVLVAVDLAGGLVAVAAGVNTWSEAWGSRALLAAPLPMVAAQLLLTWLATSRQGAGAAVAAGLLSLACLVSVVSGFFDGGLGNDRLTPGLVTVQAVLLCVTAVVGALAAARVHTLLRR